MRCPRFMHKHRHVQLENNCVLGMRGGDALRESQQALLVLQNPTVDTKNPASLYYTIVPLFPRYKVLRVMQDF